MRTEKSQKAVGQGMKRENHKNSGNGQSNKGNNVVQRFEDLIAWQKARKLTSRVYRMTQSGLISRDWGLSNQMQRASVSIMSNVAEGFERGGRAEFHQYLSTAKASCAELRSHLYVALDVGYLKQEAFDELMQSAEEESRILGGLRAAVARQRDRQRVV